MSETEFGSISEAFGTVFKKFGNTARLSNYLFKQIAQKGKIEGIASKTVEDAREWFRNEALNTKKVNQQKMMDTAGAFEKMENLSENSIGKLYHFFYDAKHKDTLPYWDKFPIVFPIEYYNDSFLGINLHYLPPIARAKLMNALYETLNNDKMNKTTKLKISYQILKSASKFKYFKPCIKKYLFSHVRSPFKNIKIEYWDYTIMLPSEQFQKSSKEKVWQDSMNKL